MHRLKAAPTLRAQPIIEHPTWGPVVGPGRPHPLHVAPRAGPPPNQPLVGGSVGQQVLSALLGFAKPVVPVMMGVLLCTGTVGVSHGQVRTQTESTASLTAIEERFEPARFTQYSMFDLFWDAPSTQAEGLTNRGEFELTRAGVERLLAYALAHDLEGRPITPRSEVSSAAREFVEHLLEHPHYGAFIEQDARPALQRAFGLPVEAVRPTVGEVPTRAGEVDLPRNVSRHSSFELRGPLVQNLAHMFEAEYASRRTFFEDPAASPEENSRQVLGLFADYVAAIRSHGNLDRSEQALEALQDRLQRTRHWAVLGSQDFNAAGWSLVESLTLGLDPNRFQISFPGAGVHVPVNYLSMNGSMAPSMRPVDDYREAIGLARRAEAFEALTVLNFMVGGESGHTKITTFTEARPFSTSGVNWGVLLFPNDAEVAALAPKPGFEFPIDAIDAFGVAFNNWPGVDRIRVYDADRQPLVAERVIHNDAAGRPESWSARFVRSDGTEVPPDQVVGLIHGPGGRIKGDGRATANLDMSFWGYCNVNTAQAVYKASYGIPQLDAEVVRVAARNGQVIEFSRGVAQRLLDADIESLVPRTAYAGFRFGRDPQTVRLFDGTTIVGTIEGYEHHAGRRTVREHSDVISVHFTPEAPLLGGSAPGSEPRSLAIRLADGTTRTVSAAQVASVTGETQSDVRPSEFVAMVSRMNGVYATDASRGPSVSNGARHIRNLETIVEHGAHRPEWARSSGNGIHGPVVREEGDRMLFRRGTFGEGASASSTFAVWHQLDATGRIINEGWITGEPDFLWGSVDPLNWSARSVWNPHFPPELRIALFVNGVSDLETLEAIAGRLNLPPNWRDYRTPEPVATR